MTLERSSKQRQKKLVRNRSLKTRLHNTITQLEGVTRIVRHCSQN